MQTNRKYIDHTAAVRRGVFKRRGLLIALIALAFGFSAFNLFGQTLIWATPTKYWICHPEYLSKTEIAGTEEVGILGIQIAETGGSNANITQVVLSPTGANTFDASADLVDIHGYITFKNAAFPAAPVPANRMTEGAFSVDGSGVITANFTGNNTITAGATLKLHISFDIGSAAASSTLAYRITSVTYQSGTITSPPAPSEIAHATMKIRDFDTTLASTDPRGTDDAEQEKFIEILKITFGDVGDDSARRRVDGITFKSLGTDDGDIISVTLYRDNSNGTFLDTEEAMLGNGTWVPGTPSCGTATFSVLATTYPATNTPYGDPSANTAVYWFGVTLATDATLTNNIQFEVTTPGGADIIFYDDVAEPVTGNDQIFTQVGYIGTPLVVQSNIHQVIEKQTTDTTRPVVIESALIPGRFSVNSLPDTNIQITFFDASGMDPASLNLATPNFILYNATDLVFVNISGWSSTVSSGNLVWTLDPDVDLEYSKNYTATVKGGAGGVQDAAAVPNVMIADYIWSFTITQQYPDFEEPIAINNKITPGTTPSVKIFVPQPPNTKPTDIVTIQIFTSTGQRVATLTKSNETYLQVLARLPIIWDGTNGRKEKLGPGLYFIQIKSADYKKILKVMIVR